MNYPSWRLFTLLYYVVCDGQLKRWIVVERLDSVSIKVGWSIKEMD